MGWNPVLRAQLSVILTLMSTYCLIIMLGCFQLRCHLEGMETEAVEFSQFRRSCTVVNINSLKRAAVVHTAT